jgi:hypothetical protein
MQAYLHSSYLHGSCAWSVEQAKSYLGGLSQDVYNAQVTRLHFEIHHMELPACQHHEDLLQCVLVLTWATRILLPYNVDQ